MLPLNWLGVDWGAVEATATALAALGTVYLLGREQTDRRARRAEAVKAQASKVQMSSVTVIASHYDPYGKVTTVTASCKVTNKSRDVISRLAVDIVLREPASQDARTTHHVERPRLDPGEEWTANFTTRIEPMTDPDFDDFRPTGTSTLSFADAANRGWRRDAAHQLYQEKHPAQPINPALVAEARSRPNWQERELKSRE